VIFTMALLLPWVTGVVLVALDGRRRDVGWLAVAVLAATLALLAVLTAQVLRRPGQHGAGVGPGRANASVTITARRPVDA